MSMEITRPLYSKEVKALCGCEVGDHKLTFCPLHESAAQLLKALKAASEITHDLHDDYSLIVNREIRAAIDAAEDRAKEVKHGS